ncbi:DUF5667 domain-containing protein [Nocardioides cheoyonin]|uniref:DUF5667 domain-containing protein n=1 Tax=Nocardioides cheoyonin TaxID=3156615 RepID=UPI0032B51938
MSPAFPTRRRADEFHRLVEGTPTRGEATPADLAELAELARELRDLPAVEPRAAFSTALRERLMVAAETELAPAASTIERRLTVGGAPGSRSRRSRRLTAGLAALAIVGGTAGTALASQGALPGETLYPVKRAIENLKTGFSVGDESKGSTLLHDAGTRLDEVHRLTHDKARPADADTVSKTLESFASQATTASDLLLGDYKDSRDAKPVEDLRSFAADGISRLSDLQAQVPEAAQGALADAAQTLLLIDQAAAAVCPECSGPGITQLPQNLLHAVSQSLNSTASDATGAAGNGQPGVSLPSINPEDLLPATVGAGQGGGATGSKQSTGSGSGSSSQSGSSDDSSSTDSGSGSGSGGGLLGNVLGGGSSSDDGSGSSSDSGSDDSGSTDSGNGGAVGDTVGGVVDGVDKVVGGVTDGVGGLLGGGS